MVQRGECSDAPIADIRPVRLRPSPRFGEDNSHTRQNDSDFSELARLGIDLNNPAMLLDDDVVAD